MPWNMIFKNLKYNCIYIKVCGVGWRRKETSMFSFCGGKSMPKTKKYASSILNVILEIWKNVTKKWLK